MTESGRRGGDRGDRPPEKNRPARGERVDKVKERIAKRTFRVDPGAVADKMVEDALRDPVRRGH